MNQLGMFAKYWEPGRVKTRLAAAIGDQAASSLYRRFVLTLLQRFAGVAQRRILAYTPAERRTEFESLGPMAGCWPPRPTVISASGCRTTLPMPSAAAPLAWS